ncbi:MAG: hypothetical protein MI749_16815, partial [Desulfovibrionales bacterium]|nr:hypothetical protein [Desulfovibrionales bacterium]
GSMAKAEASGWEAKVTLSFLLAFMTTIAAVAGVFSGFNTRLEQVETVLGHFTKERLAQQQVVIKVARIDERVAVMQEVLSEIKAELRRRGSK